MGISVEGCRVMGECFQGVYLIHCLCGKVHLFSTYTGKCAFKPVRCAVSAVSGSQN